MGNPNTQQPTKASKSQAMSPISQGSDPFDMSSALNALPSGPDRTSVLDSEPAVIRIRRLPSSYDYAQLRSLLTFADKMESTEFVATSPGDTGFRTAVARFRCSSAAQQARNVLHGKRIDADTPPLTIDIMRESPASNGPERRNFDFSATRAHSGSSASSATRFAGQFQSMNGITPPEVSGYSTAPPSSENYFQGNRQRVTGRDVIGQDGPDEETSDLLRDPVGYATNGMNGLSRQNTDNTRSASRFNNLSLNTSSPTSPPLNGYTSPLSNGLRSPVVPLQPGNMPASSYQMRPQHPRAQMPPVNPADQNPPCNTLYVGNLPIDTSEDELKQMFSRQRGYKRLCYRAKQNGPMCFVEFEDTSAATRALHELYGVPLHNSAHRGGIRLSFSKNPLGVRSGQPGGMGGPPTPLSPSGHFPGMNGVGMGAFSTASGPPPGIPTPPGMPMSNGLQNGVNNPTSPTYNASTMSPTAMNFGTGDPGGASSMQSYNSSGAGWQGDSSGARWQGGYGNGRYQGYQ